MEMDADPVYRMFLDNLREDGTSYIFEVVGDLHSPALRIKYEEVCQSNVAVEQRTRDVLRTPQKETLNNGGRTYRRPKRPFQEKSTHVGSLPLEDSMMDESFKLFFDHLRVEDGLVVLDLEPGIVIRYEEFKGFSDASPNLQAEATLFRGEHELVPYTEPCGIGGAGQLKEHDCNTRAIVPCPSDDSFQYKQNLLEVLNKPYDLKEYNQLLKEATERKPLNKQKHLRGMSVSYATNIPGMSYFDHHPDLAKKFEEADSYRRLALLRGFFFWLKNLCHEGSFIPWASSNAEMLSTCGYSLMLPPDESPLNAISDLPLNIALENESAEDQMV